MGVQASIFNELRVSWRSGHEVRKSILIGKVWNIVARILTDGSGPVFDLDTDCEVLAENEKLMDFFSPHNYTEAELNWELLERFSAMPMTDLALEVNEKHEAAKMVMSARLCKPPCGDDPSTCVCDYCPFQEDV